ncbi:hypothetical protein D931_02809 [Enterococcus faecium 13.SD.W.09]|nr:hypothetical protein D931_02809 [Enterococcus faecium 13.SD.W.09]
MLTAQSINLSIIFVISDYFSPLCSIIISIKEAVSLKKVPKAFKWVGVFLAVLFIPAFATYGIDRKKK